MSDTITTDTPPAASSELSLKAKVAAHLRAAFKGASRLRGVFSPPEIWSEKRPSLRDVWLYAKSGPWAAESGVWRALGKWYARVIALPTHAVGYYLLWILERPSRLFAAGLLYAVLTQTGIGPYITL